MNSLFNIYNKTKNKMKNIKSYKDFDINEGIRSTIGGILTTGIMLFASCNSHNSNGIYKSTMRVDEIDKNILSDGSSLGTTFQASKIDGELDRFGGGFKNKYDGDLFLSKVKEGDTIDVIIDENTKTTNIYHKNVLVS